MSDDLKYVQGLATILPEDNNQQIIQAYFTPPIKKKYNSRWLILWQESTGVEMSMQEQAEMQQPLTQTEYRVRDWLIGEIGIGNYVFVNQSEMARRLRIDRKNAFSAIKRLIDLNIIIPGPKSGRSNTYMVNPAFCFSGSIKNGIKERKDSIENIKAKIIDFKEVNK